MSNLRSELREYTQQCYGGYCSMCYKDNIDPIPYHQFSDYIAKGFKTKEIFKRLHKY